MTPIVQTIHWHESLNYWNYTGYLLEECLFLDVCEETFAQTCSFIARNSKLGRDFIPSSGSDSSRISTASAATIWIRNWPAEQRYTQIYEGCMDVSAQRNKESLSHHIWLLSNCTSQLSSASSVGISMCESKAKNMSRFLFSGQFNLALLLLRCLLLPN